MVTTNVQKKKKDSKKSEMLGIPSGNPNFKCPKRVKKKPKMSKTPKSGNFQIPRDSKKDPNLEKKQKNPSRPKCPKSTVYLTVPKKDPLKKISLQLLFYSYILKIYSGTSVAKRS
jgi:hypothetical protein